ncbi:hypothetical protein [Streptomyces sp. NPDC055140]
MNLGIVEQAAGLSGVTDVDDILILSICFAQGAGHPGSARRIQQDPAQVSAWDQNRAL